MDDLQLAVESVLFAHAGAGATITLRASVGEESVELWVGPLDGASIEARLADPGGGVGLERLLSTLVEQAELVDEEQGRWLRLEKRIPSRQQ